jgi:hypothetical protein
MAVLKILNISLILTGIAGIIPLPIAFVHNLANQDIIKKPADAGFFIINNENDFQTFILLLSITASKYINCNLA